MHCHHHCNHEKVKYCKECNEVYCESCKQTWKEACTLNHYSGLPYYIGTGTYPSYPVITCTTTGTPQTNCGHGL